MARFGARLIDHGYPVIPIMPGAKVPGRYRTGRWSPYPGWTRHCDRATTSGEVEIWSRWPGCGIGIAGGAVVGLDIDVPDAALAVRLTEVAGEMLGATPCLRIGRAPKRLLVYRAAAPFPGRKRHPVEALARGQQFVAFAIHPDTGQPYAWPDESPLDVPLADLPAVDEARCLAFLDAAWRLLPEELRQTALVHDAPTSAWRGPSDPRGTREAIVSALAHLPNTDLPWDDWFRIGMALKGALGEEGRDLWLAWSRSSGKSGKSGRTDTAERLWVSARPHSIGAGTIYWLAEQRGWSPPPELTLNARAAERAAQPHPASALLARIAAAPAVHAAATETATRQVEPVPAALLEVDGLLRDLADACTRTAIRPQPFLALGAAICAIGALAGRRYRTATNLRTNIYAAAIADSGGGKDHAAECVRQALSDAGLDRYLGGEGLASGAGLLASLQQHPARLFLVDELGLFLSGVTGRRVPPHKAEIWAELLRLYSRAKGTYRGTEYADPSKRARVDLQQPHACFYGTTTPATFWSALEGGAMADGSLARFLVFITDENYPPRNRTPDLWTTAPSLAERLRAVAAGAAGHDHGGNLAEAMQAAVPIVPFTVPMAAEAAHEHEERLDVQDRWATQVEGMTCPVSSDHG
jgi:hypothetical protein